METGQSEKQGYNQEDLMDGLKIVDDNEGNQGTRREGSGGEGAAGAGEGGEGGVGSAAGSGEGEGSGEGSGSGEEGAGGEGSEKIEITDQQRQKVTQEILSDIFGDKFKSVDEVKSSQVSERLNEYDNLRTSVSDLTEKNRLLTEQLSAYDDETFQEILKFSKFAKETGVDYSIYNRLKNMEVKDLDFVKAIAFVDIIDNPELMSKAGRIEENLKRKYKQGDYRDDDPDNTGVKLDDEDANLELEKDGLKARKKLAELKSKISSLTVEKKDVQKEKEEYLKTWNGLVPGIMSHYKTLPIPAFKIAGDLDSNGKPTDMVFDKLSYTITEEDKKVIESEIKDFFTKNHIPLSPENVVSVYNHHMNQLRDKKFIELLKIVANDTRKRTYEEVTKKFNNTSGTRKTGEPKLPVTKRVEGAQTPDEYVESQMQ
jgi:hypothetical protein